MSRKGRPRLSIDLLPGMKEQLSKLIPQYGMQTKIYVVLTKQLIKLLEDVEDRDRLL